jgi:hypothetical protein
MTITTVHGAVLKVSSPHSRTVATYCPILHKLHTTSCPYCPIFYSFVSQNLQRSLLNNKTGLTQRLIVCILQNQDASPIITSVIYFTADQTGAIILAGRPTVSHRRNYGYRIINTSSRMFSIEQKKPLFLHIILILQQ